MTRSFALAAMLIVCGAQASAQSDSTALVEWTTIPAATIERIEVFRGSGSVLYGDAAIGGVINVITRAPTANTSRSELCLGARDSRDATLQVTRKLGEAWGAAGMASADEGRSSRANELFEADERTRDAAELTGIVDRPPPFGDTQLIT